MGPESTALLYKYIIREYQIQFNSFKDDEFPEIVIHNLPIPDILNGEVHELAVKQKLKESLTLLESIKVDIIAFPCNTLTYFIEYLRGISHVPVISIVEETCNYIKSLNPLKIVLLATETTLNKKIYEKYLDNLLILNPLKQQQITMLIEQILRGKGNKEELTEIINIESKRAEYIILGCTDISVLAEEIKNNSIIDSLKILSQAIVKKSVLGILHG